MVAGADCSTDGTGSSLPTDQLRIDLSLYLLAQLVVQRNAASLVASSEGPSRKAFKKWPVVDRVHMPQGFHSCRSDGGRSAHTFGLLGGGPNDLQQTGAVLACGPNADRGERSWYDRS